MVLQATRTKVIAGLLHQHKPGLRSFHGVAAKHSHRATRHLHAAVVASVAMRKLLDIIRGPPGSSKTSGSRRRTRPDGNTVAPSSRLRLSRLSAASGALAEGQPDQASSDCRRTSTQSA